FCNGKIILFTEINNSKRGYPTFWTAPEKRLIRKLEAVGYFLYVKSVDSSNTFISSMTCLSMMFFAVSPETACAMADR
ncbi:hypothetical protein, partial [Parabacteroides merdae]|uniref:hypothetical protein n=1 Tax=Parabacteroides merdae TaxID=46503 RepID=UPI0034A2B946